MNILFLTMNSFKDIEMHNIYSDLMKEMVARGHRPFIVAPREKKLSEPTERIDYEDYTLLKVQVGNTSGVSLIRKGLSTLTFGRKFYHAIRRHLGAVRFDLILYSTPPITLAGSVKKLKALFRCPTYLMLKDIFPQNAVDLGMFSKSSPIYRYFRAKEKKLYRLSDRIGCMSPANVEYLLANNPSIPAESVELCPNGIIPHESIDRAAARKALHQKFDIPEDTVVYLFGGNLGRPQGIPALVASLRALKDRKDCYFLICGSGSDALLIDDFTAQEQPENVKRCPLMPKEEYDEVAAGCDVGVVFLDPRFTIPNFPSRALSYMENSMPLLVCTDDATDLGRIAEANSFGIACNSGDPAAVVAAVEKLQRSNRAEMGANARRYLDEHYTAAHTCERILRSHGK